MVGFTGGLMGGATISIVIQAVDKFSKTLGAAQVSLKKIGLGLGAVGVAAAIGVGAAVKKAAELESAFRNVDVILGEVGKTEAAFGDIVTELSSNLAIQGGRVEVLNGLYQVISSGITDVTDAQNLLTTATKQAVAGNIDMNTSVLALTSIMRGYGLEFDKADRVSSKLFKTVDLGQVTFGELSTNIGQTIPFAKNLGIELDELLAGMSTLGGVTGNTSEVATQLRSIMGAMIKPTQQMKDAIQALGFETAQALIEEKGFLGTLEALNNVANTTDLEMGKILGRKEALTAFFALTGEQGEKFAENLSEISMATDLLDEKLAIAQETMNAKFTIAMNNMTIAVEELGIAVGGVLAEEVLPALSTVLKDLADVMVMMDPETQKLVGRFTLIAIASLLAAGAVALLGTTFGTIFLIILGVGIALFALYETFKWFFTEALPSLIEIGKSLFVDFKDFMLNFVEDIKEGFHNMFLPLRKGLNELIDIYNSFAKKLGLSKIGFRFDESEFERAIIGQGKVQDFAPGIETSDSLLGYDTQGNPVYDQNVVNVNIENLVGMEPDAMSKALSDELNSKMSIFGK